MRKPVLLLEQARELVEEYVEGLDLSQTTCRCCHTTRFVEWQDKRSFDALTGAIKTLTRQIAFANGEPGEMS